MEKKKSHFIKIAMTLYSIIMCILASAVGVGAEAKAFDYILPESDSRYYSNEEIADMDLQVLCYAKNEIYARHGRAFNSWELTEYFYLQPWYYGNIKPENFSDSVLNKYESKNVEILTKRENKLKKGGYVLDKTGYDFSAIDNYILKRYSQPTEGAAYLFPDSDSRYLTLADVEGRTLQEICYGKNEIYARHGRKFNSGELKDYFNTKTWYSGTIAPTAFRDSVLNAYETSNIEFLTNREMILSSNKGYQLDQPGYDIYAAGSAASGNDDYLLEKDYIFPDSNTRYLTDKEVRNLSSKVLCYAKNEIYARRGRTFDSEELSDYFWKKSWYTGYTAPKDFSTDIFNAYEASNVRLLEVYEFSKTPGGYQLH